jgi:hypothetical protein
VRAVDAVIAEEKGDSGDMDSASPDSLSERALQREQLLRVLPGGPFVVGLLESKIQDPQERSQIQR